MTDTPKIAIRTISVSQKISNLISGEYIITSLSPTPILTKDGSRIGFFGNSSLVCSDNVLLTEKQSEAEVINNGDYFVNYISGYICIKSNNDVDDAVITWRTLKSELYVGSTISDVFSLLPMDLFYVDDRYSKDEPPFFLTEESALEYVQELMPPPDIDHPILILSFLEPSKQAEVDREELESNGIFIRRINDSNIGGGGGSVKHRLDDTSIHLSPIDNTNYNATTTYHGFMPKLNGNSGYYLGGNGEWIEHTDIAVPHALDDNTIHTPLSDNTNHNATTGHHGFLQKLDGDSNHFLAGDGNWKDIGSIGKQFYWLPDLTPPVLTEFTWVNQGTAVADQDNGALYMSDAPSSRGDKLRMLVKPLASQSFDVKIGFNSWVSNVNYSIVILCLYNSGSGKVCTVCLRQDTYMERIWWNSPTSYYAAMGLITLGQADTSPIKWLRIAVIGDRLYYFTSVDGYHWFELGSDAKNMFLTPDRVGFGMDPYSTQKMQALFVHWSLTYS